MAGPTTIDEYLATLTDAQRAGVEAMRRAVTAAAPEASEAIAYAMPALRSHGDRFLVSYAAFKRHYSLFPASEGVETQLAGEIEPYLTGKGTISFKAAEPLPLDLIGRIVRIRWAENAAAAEAKARTGRR
jgi:uncharacterized protein YdhG (YjbR/CyaY superfamily)